MSHLANSNFEDYVKDVEEETGKRFCEECKSFFFLDTKDNGTTQGEYDFEAGHDASCKYYETSDREAVDNQKDFDPIEHVKKTSKKDESKARPIYMSDGTVHYQE